MLKHILHFTGLFLISLSIARIIYAIYISRKDDNDE